LSIHILAIALLLSLAVALLLALKVNLFGDQKPSPTPTPTIVTSAHAERVVVMPTTGGRLEVATVRVRETFTRSDSRTLFDRIDLGTTVSEVRVDAVYRFHIGMAKAWPLRIAGRTCLVIADPVEPTLPVAFDSRTVERRTSSGWARFNRAEKSLTRQLAERAPLYRHLAQEAGRAVVEAFVLEWLVKEQQWGRDPEHRVVVAFSKEPEPQIASGNPSAALHWTGGQDPS
jgi:hypothetical protein